jgi:hypothetical protein
MRSWMAAAGLAMFGPAMVGLAMVGLAMVGLGGCVSYHQEVARLRMPRPTTDSQLLAAFTQPVADYPSVGGDILKGTSPKSGAAYEATTAGHTPPAGAGAH